LPWNRNRQNPALGCFNQTLDAKRTSQANVFLPDIHATSAFPLHHGLSGIGREGFPRGTNEQIILFIIGKLGQGKLAMSLGLIFLLIRQSRVPFSKVVVRDNGIHFFLFTGFEVFNTEVSAVSDEGRLLQVGSFIPEGL